MQTAKWPYRRGGRPGRGVSRRWRFMAVGAVVAALAAAGCSSSGSGSGSSGGKDHHHRAGLLHVQRQQRGRELVQPAVREGPPGVTVKREVVPFANLITKVLQEASAGDLPNVVMLDNPNVPEVAATGQLKPLNSEPGFTASGYVPGAITECTYQGKQYCYPIGTNTVGIFYNKAMLAAKHLSPPTTWAELQSDAKALTSGNTYGIAFDATADEQSTWQLEPFFWSQGGNLDDVSTPAFQKSLQLWVNMVKDGSASKSVLQWGQDPDLTQQFLHKTAAMIEDGPWIFPELNAAGWKYNQQYGIVPIPTERPAARWSPRSAGRPGTWATPAAPSSSRGLGVDRGHPDGGHDDALHVGDVLPAHQAVRHHPVPEGRPAVHGVREGDRDVPVADRPSTAPTTRRCRRRSGPRSSPRSPARRR